MLFWGWLFNRQCCAKETLVGKYTSATRVLKETHMMTEYSFVAVISRIRTIYHSALVLN